MLQRLATLLRRLLLSLLALAVLGAASAVLTARSADPALYPPAAGAATVPILVVDHGLHAGLILPRVPLAAAATRLGLPAVAALAARFTGYDWLEIGWGDETFYRFAPTLGDVSIRMGLRALFLPGNPSVLHVVGVRGEPRRFFERSDLAGLTLSVAGFERLAAGLDASFVPAEDQPLAERGPGLYGPSLFYRAAGHYHLFNLCNHWVAVRLAEAGIPASAVPATLPATLLLELRWRAGAL